MIDGIDASQELLVPVAGASTTVLLCHFNGANNATSSTDSSASAHTLTFHGNAKLTTSPASKFGTASFNTGTTGYITIPTSSDFALTRQFTIEFWLQLPTTLSQDGALVTFGNGTLFSGAPISWQINYSSGSPGQLDFTWSADGTHFHDIGTAAVFATHDAWHAIAIDRDESGALRLYYDGVLKFVNHPVYDTFLANPASGLLTIGGSQDGAGFLFDELRITNHGALYASDSGYTPATSAFTS